MAANNIRHNTCNYSNTAGCLSITTLVLTVDGGVCPTDHRSSSVPWFDVQTTNCIVIDR